MFDIGFWEILLVGVVALLVVGPERFPSMVKKAGYWLGRFRRIVSTVKSEIKTEVDKADQLQSLLDEQKDILSRSLDVDISRPAVVPKPGGNESGSHKAPPDVPRPIETAVIRAEKEAEVKPSADNNNDTK